MPWNRRFPLPTLSIPGELSATSVGGGGRQVGMSLDANFSGQHRGKRGPDTREDFTVGPGNGSEGAVGLHAQRQSIIETSGSLEDGPASRRTAEHRESEGAAALDVYFAGHLLAVAHHDKMVRGFPEPEHVLAALLHGVQQGVLPGKKPGRIGRRKLQQLHGGTMANPKTVGEELSRTGRGRQRDASVEANSPVEPFAPGGSRCRQ